jgi:hypothetical protein
MPIARNDFESQDFFKEFKSIMYSKLLCTKTQGPKLLLLMKSLKKNIMLLSHQISKTTGKNSSTESSDQVCFLGEKFEIIDNLLF